MKLLDILSGTQKSLNTKKISIYTCGPTVYNDIHIGNTRPMFLTDTLIRFLEHEKIKYDYLLNITDIDDKIIDRAAIENVSETALAQKYTRAFFDVLEQMNIKKPTQVIPISEKLSEMIEFIKVLVDKQLAYESNGNVYFDVRKSEAEYGKLSKQNLDALVSGARKEVDPNKKDPLDFALWKKTNKGLKWESPWGLGRPGWHTECALLIDNVFQKTIDVHVGGIDLKFPHHENERIQFVSKNQQELSHCWIYNGHLNLEGEKMSKSLGNVITAKEFLKNNTANELRYLYLTTNYSQPINITDLLLTQAQDWNNKVINLIKNINLNFAIKEYDLKKDTNDNELATEFNNYMKDNLNTTMAITTIDKIIKELNIQIRNKIIDTKLFDLLRSLLAVLGFKYSFVEIDKNLTTKIKQWKQHVQAKDFAQADLLRAELIALGVL